MHDQDRLQVVDPEIVLGLGPVAQRPEGVDGPGLGLGTGDLARGLPRLEGGQEAPGGFVQLAQQDPPVIHHAGL